MGIFARDGTLLALCSSFLVQDATMFHPYPTAVEQAMQHTYTSLNERHRRLYAAVEALKLGHGGITYIATLFECHRKTIQRGLLELRIAKPPLPDHRARKKGAADNRLSPSSPVSMMPSSKSSIQTPRAIPTAKAFSGPTCPGRKSPTNCCDSAFASASPSSRNS